MGKKVDPNKKDSDEHVSRPLASLKDPSQFGPPPKNVNYHGGAALPNEITPQTGGWGAPLSTAQISSANETVHGPSQEEIEAEQKAAGPPVPYRADRTGLKTDHLPPPPVHRDVLRSPEVPEPGPSRPKPGLPPRLPSRQATIPTPVVHPAVHSPLPKTSPPAYESVAVIQPSPQPKTNFTINQAAVNRLGNAGVSVPALGIGSEQTTNPWRNEQTKSPPTTTPSSNNQLSELQARFARMNSNASTASQQAATPPFVTPAQSPAPTPLATPSQPAESQPQPQGSTWAEKQAAMRTAQNAYKDPSTVSVSDAASAAQTANSFRERHKDQIDAAGVRANGWNKKYNVTGRLNSFLDKHQSPTSETPPNGGLPGVGQQQQVQTGMAAQTQPLPPQYPDVTASISRKPPPPPPPKKPANMHGNPGAAAVAPPPVPLGTKPSYS